MRIEALHDERGVIVAAIAFDDDDAPRPHPVASDGQSVAVIDVPDELADTPLDVLCTRMSIDVRAGTLIDRQAGETSS